MLGRRVGEKSPLQSGLLRTLTTGLISQLMLLLTHSLHRHTTRNQVAVISAPAADSAPSCEEYSVELRLDGFVGSASGGCGPGCRSFGGAADHALRYWRTSA